MEQSYRRLSHFITELIPYKKSDSLLKRCSRCLCKLVLLCFFFVLLGLIPVNNHFETSPDGIEIYFVSSPFHADIILPISTEIIDWHQEFSSDSFVGDVTSATWVTIGWGDRGFFTETPTLADLNLSTAAKALFWPSEACIHVYLIGDQSLSSNTKPARISTAQYEQLVEYIKGSFRRTKDGHKILIPGVAYGLNDAFFEAHGIYSCFNTCNSWVGKAMQSAGIRTGWFTPLPKTVLIYLPDLPE